MNKKTKKVETAKTEKKKFKCIGIERKRMNMPKYAAVIEAELNELHAQGYEMKVFDQQARTTFILGRLPSEGEDIPQYTMVPIGSIPGMVQPQGAFAGLQFKNRNTRAILGDVLTASLKYEGDKLNEVFSEIADEVIKVAPAEDVSVVIEDFEAAAKNHEEDPHHKTEEGCKAPETFRQFTQVLKSKLQLRLQ